MNGPIAIATGPVATAAEVLALGCCNVVLGQADGLRLGSARVLPAEHIPPPLRAWLRREGLRHVLIAAPHFSAGEWLASLEDDAFPAEFLRAGGRFHADFVRVLLVNSFDPGLRFVAPYSPTEYLATALLRGPAPVEARVYDPNLEAPENVAGFPGQPLHLYKVLEEERFDLIVQAVYNVDHDLRILCEMPRRAPAARLVIGGPHLRTVDLAAYFRALPIDGAILGDGEAPLRRLVCLPTGGDLSQVPGLVTARSLGGPASVLPPVALQVRPNVAALTRHLPNCWGLRPYRCRADVASPRGGRALPYDVIGHRPLRVLTSQRCGKSCYWCRSPKAMPPRPAEEVVAEIEQHLQEFDAVHVEDNEIWFNPDNFRRIGEEMIGRGLTGKPVLVKTTTDQMTAERADFLWRMGVRIVALGVESFTQRCLDLLHKGTTVEQNHRAVRLALAAGIKPGINAIWLVPGIDLAATRELALAVITYLKRGAYLNLVPELALGDIRLTPAIRRMLSEGHLRSESRHFPGARGPLDYLVLDLPTPMAAYKEAALRRTEDEVAAHQAACGVANVSVAVWSLFLLRSIVGEFPRGHELREAERSQALADLDAVLAAVLRAEEQHVLLSDPVP